MALVNNLIRQSRTCLEGNQSKLRIGKRVSLCNIDFLFFWGGGVLEPVLLRIEASV